MQAHRLLLLGCFLLPVAAEAQPLQGLYVNLEGGANFAGDLLSANQTTKVYPDAGAVGLAAVGWEWGYGLRTEIEGSYRSNAISGISTRRLNGDLLPLSNTSGTVRTYAVMANIEYDLPIHTSEFPIQPYIGAGAGYGWLDLGNASGNGLGRISLPQGNTYTGPTSVEFGSAGAFAYQAMVGASMPLHIIPGLTLTAEYRFFGMAEADVSVSRMAANSTNLVNGATPSASTHNGFTEEDSAILIGLRYTLGAN
jgi:OOP family OmpA-OmpF porin